MKIIKGIMAFTVALSIMLIVDLIINYVLSHTTEWEVFSENIWRYGVYIGKFSIGYFYGRKIYYDIFNQLNK